MEYLVALLAAIALWGIAHARYQRRVSLLWKRENGELRDKNRELEHRLKEAEQELWRSEMRNERTRARRRYRGQLQANDVPRGRPMELEDEEEIEEYEILDVPENLVNFLHRLSEKFKREEKMGDEKEKAHSRKLNIEGAEDEPQPETEEIDE